jgi:precorrin-6B methylase 2
LKKIRIDSNILAKLHSVSETDPHRLSLTSKNIPAEDRIFLVRQVAARRKVQNKIPEFYLNKQVVYPSGISVEQASSSMTAKYKSSLVEGGTMVDLTGGLGVDTYFFSIQADRVQYIEKSGELCEYARYNFEKLGIKNVEVIHANGIDFIRGMERKVTWIYVDPSRRRGGSRIFRIEDAEPDVLAVYHDLLEKTDRLLFKLSPLIDLTYLYRHFQHLLEIHIVATDHECKEIL